MTNKVPEFLDKPEQFHLQVFEKPRIGQLQQQLDRAGYVRALVGTFQPLGWQKIEPNGQPYRLITPPFLRVEQVLISTCRRLEHRKTDHHSQICPLVLAQALNEK